MRSPCLLGLLKQDEEAAYAKLKTEPLDYLQLRDYQTAAIQAVETAIEAGQRECLLAMATGTGKTRTAIGLVYRLVKSGRFRRVLFLVDRSSLGHQAGGAFRTVKLEQLKSFGDIYGIQGFEDEHAKYEPPEDDTRLHLCTIQSLVHQLLYSTDDSNSPTVDQYDCIVIDEAHRGYTLDKEMSDAEMGFRSESDYISKYRRVLDHFDAAKVALTATPALHTTEIFGDPVYTYGYRDAVIVPGVNYIYPLTTTISPHLVIGCSSNNIVARVILDNGEKGFPSSHGRSLAGSQTEAT